MSEYDGFTDDQVRQETEFMEGMPLFNWGALFMPPIWGPGHGYMLTILYYPAWLLADNLFYAAYSSPSLLSAGLAVLAFAILAAATLLFARMAQPLAAHKAIDEKGKTKEEYLHDERIWAIVCMLAGVAFLAAATYYNICVRPGL